MLKGAVASALALTALAGSAVAATQETHQRIFVDKYRPRGSANTKDPSLKELVKQHSEDPQRGMDVFVADQLKSGEQGKMGVYTEFGRTRYNQMICMQGTSVLLSEYNRSRDDLVIKKQVSVEPIHHQGFVNANELGSEQIVTNWERLNVDGAESFASVILTDHTAELAGQQGTAIFTDPSESDAVGFSGFGHITAKFEIDERQASNVQILRNRILIAEPAHKQGLFRFSDIETGIFGQKHQYLYLYEEMKETEVHLIGIPENRKSVTLFTKYYSGNEPPLIVNLREHSVSQSWGCFDNDYMTYVYWLESDDDGTKLMNFNIKLHILKQHKLPKGTSFCEAISGYGSDIWCMNSPMMFFMDAITGEVKTRFQTDYWGQYKSEGWNGQSLLIPEDNSKKILLRNDYGLQEVDGSEGKNKQVKWISKDLFAFKTENQPWAFRSVRNCNRYIPSVYTGKFNPKEWTIGTRISFADLLFMEKSVSVIRQYGFLQFGKLIFQVEWEFRGSDHELSVENDEGKSAAAQKSRAQIFVDENGPRGSEIIQDQSLKEWVHQQPVDPHQLIDVFVANQLKSGDQGKMGVYSQFGSMSDSQMVCLLGTSILLSEYDDYERELWVRKQVSVKQPVQQDGLVHADELGSEQILMKWKQLSVDGMESFVNIILTDHTLPTSLVRYVSGFSGFGDITASFQIDEHQVSNVKFLSDRILIAEPVAGKQGLFRFSAQTTEGLQKAQYIGEFSEMKESRNHLIGITNERKTVTMFPKAADGQVQPEKSITLNDDYVSNNWGSYDSDRVTQVYWIESDDLFVLDTQTEKLHQVSLGLDLMDTSLDIHFGDRSRLWCKIDEKPFLFNVHAFDLYGVNTDFIGLSEGNRAGQALIIPKDDSEKIIFSDGLKKEVDGSEGSDRTVKWISDELFAFQTDNQPWRFRSIENTQLDIPSIHTGNGNHREWKIGTQISLTDLITIDETLSMTHEYSFLQFGTMIYQVKWDYQGHDRNPLMQDYRVESIEWDRQHPEFPEQTPYSVIPYSGLAKIKWIHTISDGAEITPTLVIQQQNQGLFLNQGPFLAFDPESKEQTEFYVRFYSKPTATSASDIIAVNVGRKSIDHLIYQDWRWQLLNTVNTDVRIPEDSTLHWVGQSPFIHFVLNDELIRVSLEDETTESDPIPSGFQIVPYSPLLLRINGNSFRVINVKQPKTLKQYRIDVDIDSVHFSPDFKHAMVVPKGIESHVWMVDLQRKSVGIIDGSNIIDRKAWWINNDLYSITSDVRRLESSLRCVTHPNTPIQSPQHSNENPKDWKVGTELNMVNLMRDEKVQVQALGRRNLFRFGDQMMEVEWLKSEQ